MGFYQEITAKYNAEATQKLKRWSKLNSKVASMTNQRIFLHECKRKGLKPKHIMQNSKHLFQFYDEGQRGLMRRIEDFSDRLTVRVLNFEIQFTINKLYPKVRA